MFFIFGSPRSGTTLLAQCLDAHPDICIPHETDFIVPAAFVCERMKNPAARRAALKPLITMSEGFVGSIGEHLSQEEVEAIIDAHADSYGELLVAIYAAVAARAGKKISGDKSPNDLPYVHLIRTLGGIQNETPVLHVVRDFRDMVISVWGLGWIKEPMLKGFAATWAQQNRVIHRSMKTELKNYLLVRYEDLTTHPRETLEAVCRTLGVDFDACMLDPNNRHPRFRPHAHHARLYQAVSSSRVGIHRSLLPQETLEVFDALARGGLLEFGYTITTPQAKVDEIRLRDIQTLSLPSPPILNSEVSTS